jgi:nucleoside-diphosphate-sugar epimerase
MNADAHGNSTGRLVVFGAGYIGGFVAMAAAARGLNVTALTRNASRAAALRDAGVRTVEADLAGPEWLGQMPTGAEFVLNSVSSGGGGLEGYRHSYVNGMQRIIEWTRRGRVGTMVYTSSTSVYPQGDGAIVDETAPTPLVPGRAALLLEAEELALGAGEGVGRTFILRLAGIYGPGRHYLLDQIRSGETLAGSGAQRLNLAHRDDIAAAITACFSAPATVPGGIYNVADDHPAPKAEVAGWLAARLGRPLPRFDPQTAGDRRAVTPDRVILNHKLKQVLGWRPVHPDFHSGYGSLGSL